MLTSCSTARFKPSKRVLPDVVEYSKEVQKQAYNEALGGSCPVLGKVFMPDYGVMRDQTRAAAKLLE